MMNKGKMSKILFSIIVCVSVICIYLNNHIYHEVNDTKMIESIIYTNYLDNSPKQVFSSDEEIKNIEKRIRKINFYMSKSEKPLQQSPTKSITISYKDGRCKEIYMVESRALIVNISSKGELSGNFYNVNPYEVIWYMEK